MTNKKLLVLAILAGSAFVSVANAATGVLNFTGSVTSATCTIDTASKVQAVNLSNVGTSDFTAAGSTSGSAKITVILSACPAAAATAAVSFGGPANSVNANLLALSSTATATNLGIAFFEDDSTTAIPLSMKSQTRPLSTTVPTTLTYFAKYQSTAAVVGEGSADAAGDFTVLYN
jgi:major type 1 subunit fimbrin (pilin)